MAHFDYDVVIIGSIFAVGAVSAAIVYPRGVPRGRPAGEPAVAPV
jgi:hypothetical protein